MKQFSQLSPLQQEGAVQIVLKRLLEAITERGLRFNDASNGNRLQERIEGARRAAERMQAPQLWAGLILETCGEDLRELARESASTAVFVENETIIAMRDL